MGPSYIRSSLKGLRYGVWTGETQFELDAFVLTNSGR